MHVEPGVPRQPLLNLVSLGRGVIVRNHMNIHVLGRFALQLLENGQPLHVRVLPLGPVDQFPAQVVQRGERRDRAVTDVIVRLGADMHVPQRRAGLRTFQGLALRFLVAAKHSGLLGRVEVQADAIPRLGLELGSVGEFERVLAVGLEVLAAPDAGHAAVREAEMGGQSARGLASRFDEPLDSGGWHVDILQRAACGPQEDDPPPQSRWDVVGARTHRRVARGSVFLRR